MLSVLEEKDEIYRAQLLFMEKLAKKADKTEELSVGYKGGSEIGNVSWNKELDIWWVHKPETNRFWNGFGTEEVQWDSKHSHSLNCEINPPFEGIDRGIAGVFAKDETGDLFLLHRGLIGGGRKGIGKGLFDRQYFGPREIVRDGNRLSRLALIASFQSSRFVNQIARFVNEVKRIKLTVDITQKRKLSSANDVIPSFKDEFSGTRKTSFISNQITSKCDHGLIVNALAKKFKNEGIRIGNSRIDLFTLDSNDDLKTVFEVKTDTTSTNIFEAIGQLYYYSTNLDRTCSLVAVFPTTLREDSKKILNKLNISFLLYEWTDDEPQFIDFDQAKYV